MFKWYAVGCVKLEKYLREQAWVSVGINELHIVRYKDMHMYSIHRLMMSGWYGGLILLVIHTRQWANSCCKLQHLLAVYRVLVHTRVTKFTVSCCMWHDLMVHTHWPAVCCTRNHFPSSHSCFWLTNLDSMSKLSDVFCHIIYRKKLFQAVHMFVHLNLAISLLLGYLVFMVGIETATGSAVSIAVNIKISISSYLCLESTAIYLLITNY